MFSLQTIQKKVEKLSKSPAKGKTRAAKRKQEATPKPTPVKKRRHNTSKPDVSLTTTTTTPTTTTSSRRDKNKNKLPRPTPNTSNSKNSGEKNETKKKKRRTRNRHKSAGYTEGTDKRNTSLSASSSLPILYTDRGESSEIWKGVWNDSETDDFAASPGEYGDVSSSGRAEEKDEDRSSNSGETKLPWEINKGDERMSHMTSFQHRKGMRLGVEDSIDKGEQDESQSSNGSETKLPWERNEGDERKKHVTPRLCSQEVEQSSYSESGQKKKKKKNGGWSSDFAHPRETKEFLSSDSERSWSGMKGKKSNREGKHTQNKHTRESDIDFNINIIGECIATTTKTTTVQKQQSKTNEEEEKDNLVPSLPQTTTKTSVIAALPESATLYLQGSIRVRPLLGTVEVLGYMLRQGESQTLYSLPTASLLGVTAVEGRNLLSENVLLDDVDSGWMEEVKEKTTNTRVVVLEISRDTSPRISFLVSVGWRGLGECRERVAPWHSIGAAAVTRGNCRRNRVTDIRKEWRELVEAVVETVRCGSVPCIVVAGGKGVGKSTFFKYLANSLLSATPQTGVTCLDFDPGQPELSLPTALSLTHLTQPLLGPAYTHDLSELSGSHTHKLVGSVNPQFMLEGYTSAVHELCEAARLSGRPILVNTMGWTRGTGLGLMLDVLRYAEPTHVIQIQSMKAKLNYPFPLEAGAVMGARGGITTCAGTSELHYSLTLVPSAGQPSPTPHMSQPKALRELRVLAEAGRALEHGYRVAVSWFKVALHVCEEQVPKNRLLQVINAQLLALCTVNPSRLYRCDPDLPQLLTSSGGFGDLLGWGVVIGVDPLESCIHLATCLPSQVVLEKVNAMVMPRIHLPASLYKMFCSGEGPYLAKERPEGAARLRVGRRVKPRGPRD